MTRYALPTPKPTFIGRTLDARFLNEIANHPEVRPWLGGEGPLDLTPTIANPDNITVVAPHGGFIAVANGSGQYEVHSMFLPEGRGVEACDAMRAGLEYLFTSTDATDIVTKIPGNNRAANALARRAGFELRFTSWIPWTSPNELVAADFFGLSLEHWTLRTAVTVELGEWFHTSMAAGLLACGSTLPPHSEESDVHHRMAGLAVLLCRAGNARKAVQTYNMWARFACYPTIRLLREQPVILDLDGVVIEVRNQEMEILSCR